jgi:hypothetical protein
MYADWRGTYRAVTTFQVLVLVLFVMIYGAVSRR